MPKPAGSGQWRSGGASPAAGGRVPVTLMASQVGRDVWDRVRRKVLRIEVLRPWMRHRELDVLVDLLVHLQPRRCLEWGAGYSTAFFPGLLEGAKHPLQ